jgi:hypothetical protein
MVYLLAKIIQPGYVCSIDQIISERTRSKVHAMYKSVFQDNFFPLYDAIKFQDKINAKAFNLQ